jgi:DNA-binding IclR family transcriptional regulator
MFDKDCAEMPGKRTYNITALQRGLRVLSLLAKTDVPMSAAQLAQLSGLPASTLHRFLVNLETAGFLRYDGAGSYHLGAACVALGQAAIGQLELRALSRPYLKELNHQTRETVHLTVRHGQSAVYLDKLDSPEPVRIFSRIGASVPLHCSAVGKVLLAYLPEAERETALSQMELKRFTPNTVGSLQELQAQLQKIRRTGYACDLEEHEAHIRCIAAPVWDHTGAVTASLSITGPAVRMTVGRLRELAPLVQEAGMNISRELGYGGPKQLMAAAAHENPQPSAGKPLRKAARK